MMNRRTVQHSTHDAELLELELSGVRSPMRALTTSSQTYAERQAIVLRLHAVVEGFEVIGFGEAAPLRGWSAESLVEVRRELHRVHQMILGGACDTPAVAFGALRTASARFALSTALLDALGHARQRPLRKLLNGDAPHTIRTNAMIGIGPVGEVVDAATSAWSRGFRVLKLKVGDDADLARVAAVRAALPDVTIRLDANGAWSLDDAASKIAAFAPHNIAYIEQPTRREHLAQLRVRSAIAIAADESCLPLAQLDALIAAEAVDVLVLKPSLLGAWHDVLDVVERAQQHGVEVVFSTALDFAVAQTAIAQVAAAVIPDAISGLATGRHPIDVVSRAALDGDRFLLGSGNGLGISVTMPTETHRDREPG